MNLKTALGKCSTKASSSFASSLNAAVKYLHIRVAWPKKIYRPNLVISSFKKVKFLNDEKGQIKAKFSSKKLLK
jgi:hypothetical protein